MLEAVARAICLSCDENPDHAGDGRGNVLRWQDYLPQALAALEAAADGGQLRRSASNPPQAWPLPPAILEKIA